MKHITSLRRILIAGMCLLLSTTVSGYAQDATPPARANAYLQYMKACSSKNPPPCADEAPKAIHSPRPAYSEEAHNAKIEGTVILGTVVGVDGREHDIRVVKTIGHGLDEQAIKTLKEWTFRPAKSKGTPVPVFINVEMAFTLR